jgi:hypothetical protein
MAYLQTLRGGLVRANPYSKSQLDGTVRLAEVAEQLLISRWLPINLLILARSLSRDPQTAMAIILMNMTASENGLADVGVCCPFVQNERASLSQGRRYEKESPHMQ